ncbi:MAG: hypothetical protein L6R41_003854 [Letrouitia leprolyta]|nr:MAG: hypothetical protein L6R41_003854 [Letrouitia leprolyta]
MTLILSYYTIKALLYCYFFLIIAAAVPPTTNQIKATPQILPVGEKPFPAHAPPFPWNKKTCTTPNSAISLTFSWGDPLPLNRIYRCIEDALNNLDAAEEEGEAGRKVEKETDIGFDGKRNIWIKARPYKKHFWSPADFNVLRVKMAVQLLRECGLDMGFDKEMWAYVYNEEKQIGYIWLEAESPIRSSTK